MNLRAIHPEPAVSDLGNFGKEMGPASSGNHMQKWLHKPDKQGCTTFLCGPNEGSNLIQLESPAQQQECRMHLGSDAFEQDKKTPTPFPLDLLKEPGKK